MLRQLWRHATICRHSYKSMLLTPAAMPAATMLRHTSSEIYTPFSLRHALLPLPRRCHHVIITAQLLMPRYAATLQIFRCRRYGYSYAIIFRCSPCRYYYVIFAASAMP